MTSGAAGAPLLSIRGIVAGYGSVEVLHEVSLEVREGEIVTLRSLCCTAGPVGKFVAK